MKIHILGICGTFMGGVAVLARELGHQVSGQDAHTYPPMSTQLEQEGVALVEGYAPEGIPDDVDLVIIGNALSRGNPAVEYILNRRIRYCSGAQWLSENLLQERWVIAVAGTHGKTTTASMIASVLTSCGMAPGFLIGGIAHDLGASAELGSAPFFVVEADEYDTAFFDKRSKFVHYMPQTLVLNNLEFDHADIFDDLSAIVRQFHHLVRTVPGGGKIIYPEADDALQEVIDMGCWTPTELLGSPSGWQALVGNGGDRQGAGSYSSFDVLFRGKPVGRVEWALLGEHNVHNGLAAIAACHHAGLEIKDIIKALSKFGGVKRRMELRGVVNGIELYDDFAHHPTAIATTLAGLRRRGGDRRRILAIIEPRSNTMKMGVHRDHLCQSWRDADQTFLYADTREDGFEWLSEMQSAMPAEMQGSIDIFADLEQLILAVMMAIKEGDQIVVMSNGGFGGIHQKLLERLERHFLKEGAEL
ncbi:MAG: UDP-N-acetylmuramate:L-alanyl-gamma-D-glutamyl-meso-diaminopimelate ligase [Gammaproteobacteria bacterium]|nr:UDP-N-acetylmuramate:L-alanyl-gamma-D-glutamyl-meso-diaminopimelate ligase [Gammaproteobacteria bacterium]